MPGIVGGVLSIIGIVCNIGWVIAFCRGVVRTPTIYLLRCLAVVDTISLVLSLSSLECIDALQPASQSVICISMLNGIGESMW